MQHRQTIVLLSLLAGIFLVDESICHELTSASSCKIVSLTKHSDSLCKHEVDKTDEELYSYDISQMNSMIISGDCRPIDPAYSDDIKLRVDCLSSSSIRFRYYNLFGSDEACVMEALTAKDLTESEQIPTTITAKDGACTSISDGVFYQFRIEPFTQSPSVSSEKRQMQAYQGYPYQTAINPALSQNPAVGYTYPNNQFGSGQQTNIYPGGPGPSYIEYVNLPVPPEEPKPEDRSGIADTIYDFGQDVQRFVNNRIVEPIDQFSESAGSAVGRRYDYVGDVSSYSYQRARVIVAAEQSPRYQGQINEVNKSSVLGTGGIIGIIVGGVCLLALSAYACYFVIANNKRQGRNNNGPYQNQMGAIQTGPNFDTGNETHDNYGNNEQTFNTTVTSGQQNANQKQNNDATYGQYLGGY